MASELSGLLAKARGGELSKRVGRGECFEVHSCDGAVCPIGVKTLDEFLDDWDQCADWVWHDDLLEADPAGRWLGVVHEDGALLVRLPAGR